MQCDVIMASSGGKAFEPASIVGTGSSLPTETSQAGTQRRTSDSACEIDVSVEGHQFAAAVARVESAGGIADEPSADSESIEDSHGKFDVGLLVAFVQMKSSLEDGDGNVGEVTEDEVAGVSDRGGSRPFFDRGIGKDLSLCDSRRELAKSAAEDDGELRSKCGARLDPSDDSLDSAGKCSWWRTRRGHGGRVRHRALVRSLGEMGGPNPR